MDANPIPPLFERLPADLFRPLAAANNRRYWELLCRLVDELWGDSGRSPGEEVTKTLVSGVIQSHLVADDPWEDESSDAPNTPIAIRAHGILNFFLETGWLAKRRRGLVDMVTIKPVVAQFYTVLGDFAFQEPEFLGSKVRSIYLNLREVSAGTAGGDAFAEAARQAKKCMAHIANTGCRVHDLMELLVAKSSAREFVRGFFEDYVEKVFIADYSEIRTKDHPLQHRNAIVAYTLQFEHDADKRQQLVQWYQDKQAGGNRDKAIRLFERDTAHLLRLRDVEEHLRRLDEEIRVANQRAIAFIEYKLRAPKQLDKLIVRAIDGADRLPEGHLALPAATGNVHASEHGLAKPRMLGKEAIATRLDRREPTLEERAMESLRRQMALNRQVNPERLEQYVFRHFDDGSVVVTSDELQVLSINDLCCYQRLLLIASRGAAPAAARANDPHLLMLRKIRVEMVAGVTCNEFLKHRKFMIRKETA